MKHLYPCGECGALNDDKHAATCATWQRAKALRADLDERVRQAEAAEPKGTASMTTNELYTELMALGIVGVSERLRDIHRELDKRRRAADPGERCPHHPPASTLANVACRTCGAFKVTLDTARVPESSRVRIARRHCQPGPGPKRLVRRDSAGAPQRDSEPRLHGRAGDDASDAGGRRRRGRPRARARRRRGAQVPVMSGDVVQRILNELARLEDEFAPEGNATIERLRGLVSTLRNDVLEEAARIADNEDDGADSAAMIRRAKRGAAT